MSKGDKPWWKFWGKGSKQTQAPQQGNNKQTKEMQAFGWDDDEVTNPLAPIAHGFQDDLTDPIGRKLPGQPATRPPSSPLPQHRSQSPATDTTTFFQEEGSTVLYWVIFALLTIAYSVPLWLTSWLPMEDVGAYLGRAVALQQDLDAFGNPLTWKATQIASSLPDYLLAALGTGNSAAFTAKLIAQGALLALVGALWLMMRLSRRSRWNALLGFFLLYHGAFRQGALGTMLALPFVVLGIGCLYGWIARKKRSAGFLVISIAYLLYPLDLPMFFTFLGLCVCAAFVLSSKPRYLVTYLLWPLSSLLWLVTHWFGESIRVSPPTDAVGLFQNHSLRERLANLLQHVTLPFRDGGDALIIAGVFLLFLCALSGQTNPTYTRNQDTRKRLFYPVLTVSLFAAYFFLPAQWNGVPGALPGLFVLACCTLLGWMHIETRGLRHHILLATIISWCLFHSVLLAQQFTAYHKESQQLQNLVTQIPAQKRLLVWRVSASQHLGVRYHQVGGFYMQQKQGFSNIDVSRLPMSSVCMSASVHFPSAIRASFPKSPRWHYLLTSAPKSLLPTNVQRQASAGRFHLYRILR